jgi:ribosomal-protein-alanine acetyltransferase
MSLEVQSATAAHWTEDQYRQALQREGPEPLLLVAEASPSNQTGRDGNTGILGFLVASHVAPEWELENIVVAPRARRKGLGKRLLGALLSAARETKSSAVFLEVRESNTAACTLYERAGFEQAGLRKSYYLDPTEDAILYRLTVG